MTVAEIKKFVKSEKTRLYNQVEDSTDLMDDLDDYDELLKDILSMLDELEPKAKWVVSEKPNHFECSNCGNKRVIKTKYCSNCGARMNDELEEEKNEHMARHIAQGDNERQIYVSC